MMASRHRRGQQGLQQPHGTQKARKDYVSALEKDLKQLVADLEGDGSAHGHTRRRKEKEKDRQKEKKKDTHRARAIADKFRFTQKPGEQQATKQVVDEYKKQKKLLDQENEQLTLIAEHLQATSTATSLRFQEEILSLRDQLGFAEESRFTGLGDVARVQRLLHANADIQDEIARLRGVAEKQAVDEKEVMEMSFMKQIEAKVEELAIEKKSRKNKTGEWLVKNRKLQDEVNKKLIATEAKHCTAKQLNETRKALHVEYSAQLEDKQFLLNQMASIEKHNNRLRDRVVELETQLHTMQQRRQLDALSARKSPGTPQTDADRTMVKSVSDMSTPVAAGGWASTSRSARSRGSPRPLNADEVCTPGSAAPADDHVDLVISRSELDTVLSNPTYDEKARSEYDRIQRYEGILQKSTSLLELERRNLKGVRAAHLAALSQRTELEVFVKEAVTWGTDEARKRRPDAEGDPTLNEADRRSVIERLLSKDRVLELLYGTDTGGDDEGEAPPQNTLSPELDMNELWEKWKMWTDSAK